LIARYELAHLLFVTDNRKARDVEQEWRDADTKHLLPYYVMADALIVAGYEKPE
jgi:hypothetical protein